MSKSIAIVKDIERNENDKYFEFYQNVSEEKEKELIENSLLHFYGENITKIQDSLNDLDGIELIDDDLDSNSWLKEHLKVDNLDNLKLDYFFILTISGDLKYLGQFENKDQASDYGITYLENFADIFKQDTLEKIMGEIDDLIYDFMDAEIFKELEKKEKKEVENLDFDF